MIHLSQIRWHRAQDKILPPGIERTGAAFMFDPPSNIRKSPNGEISCPVEVKTYINIYTSKGEWFKTDYCGEVVIIHSSQITFKD